MLKLRKDRPPPISVALGDGASILIRPPSYAEVQIAAGEVAQRMAGMAETAAIAAQIAPLLGDEFAFSEFQDAKLDEVSQRLALISLVMKCQQGWTGVGDEHGNLIAEPTEEHIALLTRDREITRRMRAALEAPWHESQPDGGDDAK